jgi:hypothetical protein
MALSRDTLERGAEFAVPAAVVLQPDDHTAAAKSDTRVIDRAKTAQVGQTAFICS